MIEWIFDFAFELSEFFVKDSIRLDYFSNLDEFISFFILNFAFPILIELRKMQKLKMSTADFRKRTKDDVLELL
jgi:hypothetical protein